MAMVIACASHKGGVAKTTLCVNVSDACAREGHRVLLIDLDPQANATRHLISDEVGLGKTIQTLMILNALRYENPAHRALLFADAVFAAAVGHAAEAGQRRQGSVHDADDLAESHLVRRLQQGVTAILAAPALHHALVLEVEQDLFEKALRQPLAFRDVADHQRFALLEIGKHQQGLQRVLGFLRQQLPASLTILAFEIGYLGLFRRNRSFNSKDETLHHGLVQLRHVLAEKSAGKGGAREDQREDAEHGGTDPLDPAMACSRNGQGGPDTDPGGSDRDD